MKHLIASILIAFSFFFISSDSNAQAVWVPDSQTTWYYDYCTGALTVTGGYVKITYHSDTMIGGDSYVVLEKKIKSYDFFLGFDSSLSREYTRLDAGIVYYWRSGSVNELYDLNAVVGDTWQVVPAASSSSTDPWFLCDSASVISVLNVDTVYHAGIAHRRLKVEPELPMMGYNFSDPFVVNRLGSMGYMFPHPECVTDECEGWKLRCYYDNTVGWLDFDTTQDCDYVKVGTGLGGPDFASLFDLSPSPTSSWISLRFKGDFSVIGSDIEVINVLGQKVLSTELLDNSQRIDVSDLPDGQYLLRISNSEGLQAVKKFSKF